MDVRDIRHLFAALALLLFQVAVLNQVSLFGLARPMVYPLIILLLPFGMNRMVVMLLALLTGFAVDSFTNTPGLHAGSLVLLAWLRPHVAALLTPHAGYESGDKPRLFSLGAVWFVSYATLLLAAHHVFFFLLEVFSLAALPRILIMTILSVLLSLALVMALEYLLGPRPGRKGSAL
jgi:hypothetical protein